MVGQLILPTCLDTTYCIHMYSQSCSAYSVQEAQYCTIIGGHRFGPITGEIQYPAIQFDTGIVSSRLSDQTSTSEIGLSKQTPDWTMSN